MSTIIFAFGIAGFVLVAYWAYTNDRAGPDGGAKGLLRMIDARQTPVERPKSSAPRWRQTPARQAPRPSKTKSASKQSSPRWKRPLG